MTRKSTILNFLFLLIVHLCLSQTKQEADSLTKIIVSGNDTSKISAYDEFSRLLCGADINKAREFAVKGLMLAKKSGHKKFIASSLNRLGSVYDYDNLPDSAGYYFLMSLKIYEELKDEQGKGDVFQNLGVMHYYQQDFSSALKFYLQSLECREKTKDEKAQAQLYNNMAVMLRQEKKYDRALEMYEKALAVKIKYNDKKSLSAAYQNMATVYAIKKEFSKAIELVDKAINIDVEMRNDDDISRGFLCKADIFNLSGNNPAARAMMDLSLKAAEKTGNADQLYKVLEMRSVIDTILGDYKSGARDIYLSNFYKAKVFKQEKTKAIEKLKVVYETEKKDNEIALLNLENAGKIKEQKLLYVIIGLTVLFLFISLYYYNKKRKDNLLLAHQKQEIIEKTEMLNLQAAEIAKHSSQMNPHFIFNALNSLQGSILKNESERSLGQLSMLSKLMRLTLNNSDREHISISEEKNYLMQYVEFEKQRLNYNFSFQIQIDPAIDADNTAIPPMLIQPLIENSIKHAQLHLVKEPVIKFSIVKRRDSLQISLKDNGKGRSVASNKIYESKALAIIGKRAKETNLKAGLSVLVCFEINDLKSEDDLPAGTECIVRLPYCELV